jgi:hypothetical protein
LAIGVCAGSNEDKTKMCLPGARFNPLAAAFSGDLIAHGNRLSIMQFVRERNTTS